MPLPDQRKLTQQRIQRTEAYAAKIQKMFSETVNELLALPLSKADVGSGEMFSFDDQTEKIQREAEQLLRRLHATAQLAVQTGVKLEWEEANKAADAIMKSQYSKKVLSSSFMKGWNARNMEAMQQFIRRSDNGMNLSNRIWQSCRQLRDEMEVALTVSIGEGQDAGTISRRVRQYLNDPDLMFRRFRYKDEQGRWQTKWKKRIQDPDRPGKYRFIDYDKDSYKDQWTGRGYYKSSAQNAMRVARTETNIAYRRADHERWQGADYVLGQRVQLSRSHPEVDICDDLAGDYPKEFVFDGWHPQCFCFVTPIMVSPEEMQKATEAFLRGEEYTPKGKRITDYPQGFKDWVNDNADKIAEARLRGTEPYFIRNNASVVDGILNPKKQLSIAERAKMRHDARTPEMEAHIREQWQLSRIKAALNEINIDWDNSLDAIVRGPVGKTINEQLGNYIRALKTLSGDEYLILTDGKRRGINISLHDAEEYLSQRAYSKSDAKKLVDLAKKKMMGYASQIPRIKDIVALKNADISKIPFEWRAEFLDAVNKIKGASNTLKSLIKNTQQGIALQYGNNMIELSTNAKAIAMGLGDISPKTPVQLFTVFEAAIPGYSDCLKGWSKDFFNSLKEFVPLRTDLRGAGCYYQHSQKFVHINPNDPSTAKRLKSDYYKKSIISHEYGHAMFHQYDWANDAEIRAMYDKWVRAVNADKGAKIMKLIEDRRLLIPSTERGYGFDVYEQLGKISDSAQAAIKGHVRLKPMGHDVDYFDTYVAQLNEIIAHCSENLWVGNPIFKQIAPGLYEKMRELMKRKLGLKP